MKRMSLATESDLDLNSASATCPGYVTLNMSCIPLCFSSLICYVEKITVLTRVCMRGLKKVDMLKPLV